jgi:hypothetical protein
LLLLLQKVFAAVCSRLSLAHVQHASARCIRCCTPAFRPCLTPAAGLACAACRYQPWPNDALEAVAHKFLAAVEVTERERGSIMEMCKTFHSDVRGFSEAFKREAGRINYVTPTSYLELINTFCTLLAAKKSEVRWLGTS